MKNKIFTILLAVMASVGTMFAETYSGSCGENLTWSLNTEDGVLTISGTGAMADYANKRAPWYNNRQSIVSAIIENNVTSIGDYAFYECDALSSVTIGNGVTSIGSKAFKDCWWLTTVNIPNNVTYIGEDAFVNCSSLPVIDNIRYADTYIVETVDKTISSISFKNGTKWIGKSAFYDCDGLTSVIIPSGVTNIGDYAFGNCSNLTSIEIPNSVINIGYKPFTDCAQLTTVHLNSDTIVGYYGASSYYDNIGSIFGSQVEKYIIGNDVTTIGAGAFSNCKSLTSIEIPNSVTSIGSQAFYNCTGLTSIDIPNSVASIGSQAFYNCTGMTSIDIPNGVTNIEDNVFYNCTGLVSVAISNSVANIGVSAFEKCSSLTFIEIPSSVISIGGRAFYDCSTLKKVTIGENVASIGARAFEGCQNLDSIRIPRSVTNIGSGAFQFCNRLNARISDLTAWCGISFGDNTANPLYFTRKLYLNDSLITDLIIPEQVTRIGDYAFVGCRGLKSVKIPNSVTSIGNYVFQNCTGLTSIMNSATIPQVIDLYCFYNVNISSCTLYVPAQSVEAYKVADVWKEFGTIQAIGDEQMPCVTVSGTCGAQGDNLTWTLSCDSVLTISGTGAMAEWISSSSSVPWYSNKSTIRSVIIENGVTSIVDWAFENCTNLISVTIPNSFKSIGVRIFSGCTALTSVTIPNSVTSIEKYAFYGCSALTSIEIPNSVTSMAEGAFASCLSLTSIEIPNSVTSIAYSAFEYCTALTSIAIPNSVTNIGDWAFYGCSSLTTIEIPNSVTSIGRDAFLSCNSLTSIEIPNSVTSIGNETFSGCSGLTSVMIPNNVTSIGDHAFYWCIGLPSITIPNSVTSIGNEAFSGCTGLTSITNLATTPQAVTSYVFGNPASNTAVDYSACTLYVPAESVEAYQTAEVWKEFTNILPIGESSDSCVIASGTCGAQGDNLTWTLTCDSVLTISGTGLMEAFNNTSDNPWYLHRTAIKSAIIGSGVTSIGSSAFEGCSGLTSIEIPNSVTNIGEYAFFDCSGLTSIHVANNNPNYCSLDGVLFNKDKTTLVQYPGGKQGAYIIPNSVTSIGDWAFGACSGLTSIEIPNSVKSIGGGAFFDCSGLTSVTIGNSVTSIGDWAFSYCSGLTSVTIPNSVTSIGYSAFEGCSGLTSIEIPNSVTSIGNSAFKGCSGLTSFTNYATTPQAINTNVFTNVNLSACALYVPAESVDAYQAADVWKEFTNILPIGESSDSCVIASGTCGAQGDNLTWTLTCDRVLTISGTGAMEDYNSDDSAPWFSFKYTLDMSVVIEEGVTYIGKDAFAYYGVGIKSVTIPSSVISIGNEAFISSATAFFVDDANPNYSSLDGVLFNKDQTTLIYYPVAKRDAQYTIPNTVNTIGHGAFYGCDYLNSIIIPNSVTAIEGSAFRYCRALTSVSIPNSVLTIGYDAFEFCDNLETVYIPSSVISIGNSAFAGNKKMRSINVDEANLYYCSMDGVLFNKDQTKLLQYPNGKGDTLYIIPNTVTTLGSMSFSYILKKNSVKLTSIVIPSSVTTINANAFWDANDLASITNYTVTPQWVSAPYANISSCTLYVPAQSLEAYQAADFWKDFANILPIEGTETPIETVEGNYTIYYVDKADQYLTDETVTLHVPVAPVIEGFTFVEWRVAEGSLSLGITIQAIYEANEPTSAPEIYTNPANSAQKLIRNGNVYILTDDKVYTITGQEIQSY